jgi:hypothetical protein
MSYYVECNWCGANLHGRDHAQLGVLIKRTRRRLRDETRPMMHFCVADDGLDYDRLGLEPGEEAESCLTRALAAVDGTELQQPDMGMEWRLVPVGSTVRETEVVPADTGLMAEPLWEDAYRGRGWRRELVEQGLDLDSRGRPGPFNVYRLRDHYETVGDLKRAIDDESLRDVKGVGPSTFAWIKEQVYAFLASETAAKVGA